ncbi:DUF6082 family protein [Actinomadura sp. LOL_011]|uniref:DUF6082 family protein n=1 Tax=Actinomadura sp. LOL_011 TaxID=3345410 RepID=UPI003A800FA9
MGQTYGAVSALLAAGALVVLGFSVALQAGEARHAREQAARGTQFELMRMILDDPVYREGEGGSIRRAGVVVAALGAGAVAGIMGRRLLRRSRVV